jgi:hypothetical protein
MVTLVTKWLSPDLKQNLFSADFGKNTHYKILRKSSWRKLSCSLCMDRHTVHDGAHSAFSQFGEHT